MLAILALPVLLFSQLAVAHPSDLSLRDLEELYDLLAAEKRTLEEDAIEMSKRKGPNYDCEQPPLEMGLIVDSSVSIDKDDYVKGLRFLANFTNYYVVQPDKVRFAAVSFGFGVYSEDAFNLSTYSNNEGVQKRLLRMPFKYGNYTDTGGALRYMRTVQMNNNVTRPNVPKFVMVLTDGNSQRSRNTSAEAQLTKDANITVIAVGVGDRVKYTELLNIAGGVHENVIRTADYEALLNEDFQKKLSAKTCILIPTTTTTPLPTTTTMQATEPCGKDHPVDINFVFSPAASGLVETSFTARTIRHIMTHDKLQEGTRYGLVSGDCPRDEGWTLEDYSRMSEEDVEERLRDYDHSRLPDLITKTTTTRFDRSSGGQEGARKVAVIFLGQNKKNNFALEKSIREMMESGVEVYISTKDGNLLNHLSGLNLPGKITLLTPTDHPTNQAVEMVNELCKPVFIRG